MSGPDYFDHNGMPCGLDTWMSQMSNRLALKTQVGMAEVSTVYIGLGHLCETMIFFKPGAQIVEVGRWSSIEEAGAAHALSVVRLLGYRSDA